MKAVLFGTLLLVAPVAARAQEQGGPPPGHTHDGFYARLQAGAGYLSARQRETTFSGGTAALGFALGGVVCPNLALFATIFFHFAEEPNIQVNGVSMPISGSTVEDDSFGAGLAYYLMPLDVHAAAAISGTSLVLYDKNQGRLAASSTGLGFQVLAGKEWWISREWGLGAAAELTGAWMNDAGGGSARWSAFTYALLLSATYN